MRKLPPIPVFLITTAAYSVLFTMMGFISALYRVETVQLNPLQLVLVGTALETAIFIFEVPTGVVADVYSRRLSVIIGYLLIGCGFMLEGALPLFATIILAQIVWGIGYTFISGAQDAWLADEIGEERLTSVYLRASQIGRMGSLAGIFIGAGLGTVGLGLPIFLAGALLAGLGLFLMLFMPETGFAPTPRAERTRWQTLGDTFRDGLQIVRGRPILMFILAITAFLGLASEGLDRLWAAHMLQNLTFPAFGSVREPVVWFAAISVTTLLLGLVLTEYIRRRVRAEQIALSLRLQFLLNLGMVVAVVVFGLANRFSVAVVAIIAVQLFRGANHPLFSAWINRQIEPRVRATVLSMDGQVDAIGQIVGGPILGVVATAVSIPAALIGVGVLMAPVLPLYLLALRLTQRSGAVLLEDAAPS